MKICLLCGTRAPTVQNTCVACGEATWSTRPGASGGAVNKHSSHDASVGKADEANSAADEGGEMSPAPSIEATAEVVEPKPKRGRR